MAVSHTIRTRLQVEYEEWATLSKKNKKKDKRGPDMYQVSTK